MYFVTSLPANDVLRNDDAHLEEPLQELDQVKSNDNQDITTETTILATIDSNNDELDSHVLNHDQDRNDITIETTTITHRKFSKSGKNSANYATKSTCWLIVSLSLLLSIKYF